MGELCHVGARFEALDESVLTVPSVWSCIFFTILTLLSEQCVPRLLGYGHMVHRVGKDFEGNHTAMSNGGSFRHS